MNDLDSHHDDQEAYGDSARTSTSEGNTEETTRKFNDINMKICQNNVLILNFQII